jgi:predicted porin
VVAGVRYQPNSKLTAELGGRYNLRMPNDGSISDFESLYLDARLDWEVTDTLSLGAEISRENDEPTKDDSIVRDVKRYSVTATLKPVEDLRLDMSASHKKSREVGAERVKDETKLKAVATYSLSDYFDIFAEAEQEWETDSDTDSGTREKAKSTQALVGVKTTF